MSLLKSNQQSPSSPPPKNVVSSGWSTREDYTQLDAPNSPTSVSWPVAERVFDEIPHGYECLTPHSLASMQLFLYFFPPGVESSPEEAEKYLKSLRTNKLKYFPFLHIPGELSSEHFAASSHFYGFVLWLLFLIRHLSISGLVGWSDGLLPQR
jgi:hypothetical protein